MSIAWLKGGHTERFAVAVQLLLWIVFGSIRWRIGDVYLDSMIEDSLAMLIFASLSFRSNRWWLFVATAALVLTVLVHVFTIITDISWDAAVSARVGLGLVVQAALLFGPLERWLAGEKAVSDTTIWRRPRRAT